MIEKELPSEVDAKRQALFGKSDPLLPSPDDDASVVDTYYSMRFAFSGFIFSLVDSSPSEICTIAVENINAIAKWNEKRTSDASALLSIGWLQVDNHIPSAPFPVAICPDGGEPHTDSDDVINPTRSLGEAQPSSLSLPPLLFVGVEIAPKHSSGIVVSCLFLFDHAAGSLYPICSVALVIKVPEISDSGTAKFGN